MELAIQKLMRMHKTKRELETLLNAKITAKFRGGKPECFIDKKALAQLFALKMDAIKAATK